MKIEINLKNVSKEEIEELKKYLEANCWDWKQNEVIMDKKIMKTRVISSKEDWIRMDREEAARKECKLNKKKPFTRFQWVLISLGFKGVNRC